MYLYVQLLRGEDILYCFYFQYFCPHVYFYENMTILAAFIVFKTFSTKIQTYYLVCPHFAQCLNFIRSGR